LELRQILMENGLITRLVFAFVAALAITTCGDNQQAAAGASFRSSSLGSANRATVSTAELKSAVTDAATRRFYESRNWRAAWSDAAAQQVMTALDGAERHGLVRSMFLPNALPDGPAQRDAALTKAALGYAAALARGRTDPSDLGRIYTMPKPDPDVIAGLATALRSDDLQAWLGSLAPQTPAYRALSTAYIAYRAQAAREAVKPIDSGELLRPGTADPRVPVIVNALEARGFPIREMQRARSSEIYTPELMHAVKRLQSEHGIAADGIVGPDTLEMLNTTAADRALQIAVNLERLRWLERKPPATRIDVNTAAAHLDYWRDGVHHDHRRVVVGQADWPTPRLQSPIYRLVANPTWTVPKSIERAEIAPKGEAYLRRHNMARRNGWIVQLPGPGNALGQVKFDMSSDYAIYLHDTPAKQLFGRSERHRSHGCVRVEDALEFAQMIAKHDGRATQFERALASGDETFVSLSSEIPVRLFYHTAFVDRDGQVRFRSDAYGWDDELARALGLHARHRPRAQVHADEDIGP
jgi:L,D-transpeptidase YcbB